MKRIRSSNRQMSQPGNRAGSSKRMLQTAHKTHSHLPPVSNQSIQERSLKSKTITPKDASTVSAQLVRPRITFRFEDAVEHLKKTDERWGPIFERIPCPKYQSGLDQPINIFRTLSSGIMGQQISYKAAGAITRRFVLIWFKEEEVPPATQMGSSKVWPTPEQVAAVDMTKLREAGLSGRKAEYIIALAQSFVDGILDPAVLIQMDDEEVMKTLCEVRGIGPWTCHMLLMFAFKRPDILPVGDIGVQKGVLKWFKSSTTEMNPTAVSGPEEVERELENAGLAIEDIKEEETKASVMMTPPSTPGPRDHETSHISVTTPTRSSKRARVKTDPDESLPLATLPPTPAPTSKTSLKKRKLPKGTHMHADEMESLCEIWRPYRSIASWYLWALAGEADYEY